MTGKIILAGASGYLGGFIAKELKRQGRPLSAFGRNAQKLRQLGLEEKEIERVEVTNSTTFPRLKGPIDAVISTVGITRQKDGLSYMDVDYQANIHLLDFALRHRARKFIYLSVLHGDQMRKLKITEAKERFVDVLKASGMNYTIVRPNGFYSDMKDFLAMARSGRIFLFGDGEHKLNPIHGLDLARVVVDLIDSNQQEVEVGGPDILTQNEIAALALQAMHKEGSIIHLPDWLRKSAIGILRACTASRIYGPIEFFLTMAAKDNIAPRYGIHRLETFFREESDRIEEK